MSLFIYTHQKDLDAKTSGKMSGFITSSFSKVIKQYPFVETPYYEPELTGALVAATDKAGQVVGTILAESHDSDEWLASVEVSPWNLHIRRKREAFELTRGLYAKAFADAVAPSSQKAALRHVVYCGAKETEVQKALVSLGFGLEQVYASRTLVPPPAAPLPGINIRPLTVDNRQDIAALSDLIIREHSKAPIWAGLPPVYVEAIKKGFSDLHADSEAFCLIAYECAGSAAAGVTADYPAQFETTAEIPVGYQCWNSESETVAELSVGAVVPNRRGRGIGTALFAAGAAELAERGFTTAVTDWRSANLYSSRFWPKCGFVPYMYRFVRRFHPYQIPGDGN